jgi:hypothetical protein
MTIKVQELSQGCSGSMELARIFWITGKLAIASVNKKRWVSDLITLNFGGSTLPSVERFMSLDTDGVMSRCYYIRGELRADMIKTFYIPQGTFVKIEVLILYRKQFETKTEEAHALYLLSQRTCSPYNLTLERSKFSKGSTS